MKDGLTGSYSKNTLGRRERNLPSGGQHRGIHLVTKKVHLVVCLKNIFGRKVHLVVDMFAPISRQRLAQMRRSINPNSQLGPSFTVVVLIGLTLPAVVHLHLLVTRLSIVSTGAIRHVESPG